MSASLYMQGVLSVAHAPGYFFIKPAISGFNGSRSILSATVSSPDTASLSPSKYLLLDSSSLALYAVQTSQGFTINAINKSKHRKILKNGKYGFCVIYRNEFSLILRPSGRS